MEPQILPFVAVTSAGKAYDIEFPLHPQTRSAEVVSTLVTALLDAISKHTEGDADISDGDVLQALSMTRAIRARMIDAEPGQIDALNQRLHESAWTAVQSATGYSAARA